MIVQSTPEGQPHFVISQVEHARAAGRLAEAFGNDRFNPLAPLEELIFVTAHHDEGWAEVDALLLYDTATGLPVHLFDTPFDQSLITNRASPDFNTAHHPLCGLLSSMHTCGFFNGRYGMMEVRPRDLSAAQRAALEAMLAGERQRQQALSAQLKRSARTYSWAQEAALMDNYRRLQFFDLLALYFHLQHADHRTAATLPPLPTGPDEAVAVTVTPLASDRYRLDPFPFHQEPLELATKGRYLRPQADADAMRRHVGATPVTSQRLQLVA